MQNSSYAMNANTEFIFTLILLEGGYTALTGSNAESSCKTVIAALEIG